MCHKERMTKSAQVEHYGPGGGHSSQITVPEGNGGISDPARLPGIPPATPKRHRDIAVICLELEAAVKMAESSPALREEMLLATGVKRRGPKAPKTPTLPGVG